MIIDEFSIGMANNGPSIIDEGRWEAIYIEETPPSPPPGKFSLPWWPVVIGAAVAVIARTNKILGKKEKKTK